VEDQALSARADVKPPAGGTALKDLKIVPMDWQAVERQAEEIKTRFAGIVGR
jgi:hypothetical protein